MLCMFNFSKQNIYIDRASFPNYELDSVTPPYKFWNLNWPDYPGQKKLHGGNTDCLFFSLEYS